jgi:uncharacterized protein (DUF2062 family)
MPQARFIAYLDNKVYQPLLGILKDGASPQKLAHAVAWGSIMGMFPIFGSTTIICIGLAFLFRLNHAAIQIANYAVYPLQFILLIPFIQIGLFLTGQTISTEELEVLIDLMTTDIWAVLGEVGSILWAGLIGWTLVALPIYSVVYFVSFRLFKKVN